MENIQTDLRSALDQEREKGKSTNANIKEALALVLFKLVDELIQATSFNSKKELKAVSMLQTDKIFSDLLTPFLFNKKFYKGKHTKDLMKAIGLISKALGNIEATEKEGFLKGIFNHKEH